MHQGIDRYLGISAGYAGQTEYQMELLFEVTNAGQPIVRLRLGYPCSIA